MKLYTLYNRFYLLPALSLEYDTYYEGGLIYLELTLTWGKWQLALILKK